MTDNLCKKKITINLVSGREISMRNIKRRLGTGDIYNFLCGDTTTKITYLKEAIAFCLDNNLNYLTAVKVKHVYPKCISCQQPINNHSKECLIHYPICICNNPSRKGCHSPFCNRAYPFCQECGVELNRVRHSETCSKAKK
jgi:hypothetical protein